MRALAVFAIAMLAPAIAVATPSSDFVAAKERFRAGQFSEAIELFSSLLYPRERLTNKNEVAEAHLLLGISYFQVGNQTAASTELEEALNFDMNLSIEPPLITEEASRFFRTKKEEVERRIAAESQTRLLAAEAARLQAIIDNMVVVERRKFYVNFIPFGAGQFQNGHRGKGTFFLASQTAFGGASLGLYMYQVLRYGFSGGKVPQDELDSARTIQAFQISSGAVAIGLMIYGILDAWYYYQPEVSREPSPEYLKQLEELNRRRKTDSSERGPSSFLIVPMAGPDSVGAALRWEF